MANFDWQDCMPVNDDSTEVYLAKYKRLQYVYQVCDITLLTCIHISLI